MFLLESFRWFKQRLLFKISPSCQSCRQVEWAGPANGAPCKWPYKSVTFGSKKNYFPFASGAHPLQTESILYMTGSRLQQFCTVLYAGYLWMVK